ncbi:hypothetical protein F5Y18DRAFT_432330 [Xylariaceae sp. FL1019]|nr:hypothetical protein F5Y18DRAFT_432330 [Xylariaceae sp. FL1019]
MGPLWESIIRSLEEDQPRLDGLEGPDRYFSSQPARENSSQDADQSENEPQALTHTKECEGETKHVQEGAAAKGSNSNRSDESPCLGTERDEMVEEIIDRVTPRLQRLAREAAEQEFDRMIESALGETTEQKIQAVLSRVQDLEDEDLEDLFLRRSTMAVVLRRLLERIEQLEEENEWEDLGGRRLG